jgi:hypothetical protein
VDIPVQETRDLSIDEFALIKMIGVTSNPTDLKATAFALRLAKSLSPDVYANVLAHAVHGRAEWRKYLLLSQRKWQTNVSHRPQRGNHHDSWAIRERYVRCAA